MHANKFLLSCLGVITLLVGCSTAGVNQADRAITTDEKMTADVISQRNEFTPKMSTVSTVEGIYVASESITLGANDVLPSFFDNHVSYSAHDPISFQNMIGEIQKSIKRNIILTHDALAVLVVLDSDAGERDDPDSDDSSAALRALSGQGLRGGLVTFALDYEGALRGLLDTVASKANLFWKWENGDIVIFRHETRTYVVDANAGTSAFSAVVSSDGESDSGTEEGGTSGNASFKTEVDIKQDSPYAGLVESFEAIKTPDGKYSLSPSTGVVTFTDTPIVLAKVEAFIENLNRLVNKNINIRAEIYDVFLSDDIQAGIDWNAFYQDLNLDEGARKRFSILSSSNTDISGNIPLINFGLIDGAKSADAFVNLLRTYANVSLVTSSNIYTTNGQPAPLQVLDTQAYLKKRTVLFDDDGDIEAVELEQGVTSEGVSLTVLPKVTSKNEIQLQIALDLSLIKDIAEFGDANGSIQLPARSVKNFLQNVNLRSGSSVMISGFDRTINRATTKSLGEKKWWLFGGSKNGGEQRVMTVILITPYITSA